MKKVSTTLAAIFCLILAAGAAFAQQPTAAVNFAGSWELDVAKSKLPERARVESMTLNVAQNATELKVETSAKRAPRPEGMMPNDGSGGMPANGNRGMRQGDGPGTGGGTGRSGVMGNGNGKLTYSLDGKETIIETETPGGMPPAPVKLLAEMKKDGKLKLVSTRSFDSPQGSVSIKTTEIWELSGDGKNLKITRDTETPRGAQSSEMYFSRKVLASGDEFKGAPIVGDKPMMAPVALSAKDMTGISGSVIKNPNDKSLSGASPTQQSISKGVLNSSALSLVKPAYPAEARQARAGGAVNVNVTIDEQGRVVSAKAVSGHETLRAAAEEAARKSTFSPTMLEGIPVKVTGTIVYNFVP